MFNAMEFKQLKQYIDQGGSVLVMLGEGGENKYAQRYSPPPA